MLKELYPMLATSRNSFPRAAALKPTQLAQAVSGLFVGRGTATLYSGALLLALQSGAAMAQTAPAEPTAAPAEKVEAVIVTGTRRSGLKAIDSASPIQVLDSASLERTGQPDLIQAMAQNLPSFQAQSFGSDAGAMTLSARLRGLSPNDTLVLVNGKRRHTTANLAVLAGPFQGGAAADLNFIPVAAIDHVEVLQDGAAAQYGTDAIAGVVNMILKKDSSGGTITTTGGGYFDGGGTTGDVSFNKGFEPNEKSYINITGEHKYHGHSDRGAADPRITSGDPYVNKVAGDAAYHLSLMTVNAGYDLGNGAEVYSNATYGKKTVQAFENYRVPSRLPAIYPNGFNPKMTADEKDFGATVGVKGVIAGDWNWDLSTTYGKDDMDMGVINSGNLDLYKDTGATPTSFHAGNFTATQSTTNLDMTHDVNVGWASPLTLAGGLEYRKDTYEIGAGDAASRYKGGSQSYPGFSLTDAGKHDRNDKSVYFNVAGSPVKDLKLDAAARYEKYSDFGSARVGKLTARYDFTPTVGLRSTISNGFRAPTMAEQYYSATNVSPTQASVQLAPNSAAAKLVGINGLKPEQSSNFSVGLVLKPAPRMSLTVDAYVINIRDRIVGSGTVFGTGNSVNSPAVLAAILANGNVLDSTVTKTGISIFSNAVNTQNKGLEAVYSYNSDFGANGRVDWSLAGNYNKVEVTKVNALSQLAPQSLLDRAAIASLETSSPKVRINMGALWKRGDWSFNLRESVYGPSSGLTSLDNVTYYETKIKTLATTDLEVSYRATKQWTLSVGANNLFNKYPDQNAAGLRTAQIAAQNTGAVNHYPSFSPIGINGGYYYGRVSYSF
jgi:iron complex outermembrane receptor protein